MEPSDVRCIAFVTRRFFPLQGFRRAAYVCWLLLVVWLFNDMESGRSLVGMAFVLSWCLGPQLIELAIKTYYGRRVGRVAHGSLAAWQWGLPMVIVIALAMNYDLRVSGSGRPSVAALQLGALALLDVIRDWPWRWYRAFDVAACVAGSLLWAVAPLPAYSSLIAVALIAAVEIITGYLDHRLLVRVLGASRQSDEQMERLSEA